MWIRTLALLGAILLSVLSGCAVVPAEPSPSRDGKCHGPDYNAPTCIYLF